MKKLIILFAFGLLARQVAPAQGSITYLSNLGHPSTGSIAVGSDSWQATVFHTGSNIGGYVLDSIQLALTPATGDPNSFAVLLYSSIHGGGEMNYPGSSLGILDGPSNPAADGIFTFTPDSSIILSPRTSYFIVLTAGTAVANGAYEWASGGSFNSIGGWTVTPLDPTIDNYQSSNGSTWNLSSGASLQFAISATPVPEPGVLSLLGLGGAALLWRRWQAKTARVPSP
ncbi:MAG TPA: choice-of-anchor R domain-containing protein [Verrucomicrobiae bacterium]|nr:choice-of-anchor R domain-containing protein [Verrucomicrobiae bacterium]